MGAILWRFKSSPRYQKLCTLSVTDKKPKIIVILGPTASGKSALGEKLCLEYNGEIISADSRQVFKKLDLGTGKEKLKVPQHLIDVANLGERYTVVDWKKQADKIIERLVNNNKVPVIVGGSSLYVQALIDNYQFAPEDVDGKLRKQLMQMSKNELLTTLKNKLPNEADKFDPDNKRYLVRAIEKHVFAGKLQSNQAEAKYDCLLIGIDIPRKKLYLKIDQRVDDRMNRGMLREVEELIKGGTDPAWLMSLGLEYRYLTKYLLGELKKDMAINRLKFETHHFARRQLIWWRRRTDINWINDPKLVSALAAKFLGK